jgi:uncharacterized protein (TIGR03086 family)
VRGDPVGEPPQPGPRWIRTTAARFTPELSCWRTRRALQPVQATIDGSWVHDRGMQTLPDYRPLLLRALVDAGEWVARVDSTDLGRSTPCAGWDLKTLLAHCIGQNQGFAEAVETGDAPQESFAHRAFAADDLQGAWRTSAERLTAAFDEAPLDRIVSLAEIRRDNRFPVSVVVGFQLLDTVIHTWDIASALGEQFRPDDELVQATAEQARRVPQLPSVREGPGASFAPVLPFGGTDSWVEALALLGRLAAGQRE